MPCTTDEMREHILRELSFVKEVEIEMIKKIVLYDDIDVFVKWRVKKYDRKRTMELKGRCCRCR